MLKFSEIYRAYPGQERRWRLHASAEKFFAKPPITNESTATPQSRDCDKSR